MKYGFKFYILSLCFVSIFVNTLNAAEQTRQKQLTIDAQQFESFNQKGLSVFTGNVKMKRVNDTLNSDKLEVYMTPKTAENPKTKRTVLKYIATGNVSFSVYIKGKHYKGQGNKIVYNPQALEYEITGKASIKETVEDKTLIGDRIILNERNGEAKVEGSDNKPVRFIMTL